MKQQPNNERPADLAVQDSVGGMARRLLNPAHLKDLARRSVATLREQGAEQLWRDVSFRVGLAFHHDDWRHRADLPLRRTLKAQRAANLQGPCISVVVPVFNTPLRFFDQMVKSVQRQTYGNWQLVLVDASDGAHGEVSRRAQQYAAKDSRIVYRKIDNKGIAANTTAGFAAATGGYLALLDHDDVLYPNALFECVQTIQKTGADFVYSDEIVLSADLKQLGGYHFKPDFAPDYLRGVNFITHLAVFSRPLLDAAGAYESREFDGAQDHDLILRLTEALYQKYALKRVFYSAYLPVVQDPRLPALTTRPPLLREHRLYQADWLLRYYHFSAEELLSDEQPNFDPYLDPKCSWALNHPEYFPVEVNTAPGPMLLRVPGIGPKSARRILAARRGQHLGLAELKRIGVVLKRAQYFITCGGRALTRSTRREIAGALVDPKAFGVGVQQLSLDDFCAKPLPDAAPALHRLAASGVEARQAAELTRQEAITWITRRM